MPSTYGDDLTRLAADSGLTLEEAAQDAARRETFDAAAAAAAATYPDTFAGADRGNADSENNAWIGFVGEIPSDAVALVGTSQIDVELRGDQAFTPDERERITNAGTAAFDAQVGDRRVGEGFLAGMEYDGHVLKVQTSLDLDEAIVAAVRVAALDAAPAERRGRLEVQVTQNPNLRPTADLGL